MKSRKVAEINGRNIILVDQEYKDTKWIQWVVSRTYDETQPENQKWDSGVYFDSLTDAVNYATGKYLFFSHKGEKLMNNVSITGRITRMIDSKSTDGYTILNFSIADNKTAKQTGRSQFFNCVIFRQGADTMKKYAKVGDRISITGTMQWQDWNKSNFKKDVLKIIVDRFELCGKAENEITPEKEQENTLDNLPFPKDFSPKVTF